MNTPTPTNPETVAAADELQQEIQALVQALKDALEQSPDIYRKICQLACTHRVGAEDYRSRLVRAGMAPARACDFKTLLRSPSHCEAFLRPRGAVGRHSWSQALRGARSAARGEELGLDFGSTAKFEKRTLEERMERALLAAQVAGLLHRSGSSRCEVAGGTLALTSRVGHLDALLEVPAV